MLLSLETGTGNAADYIVKRPSDDIMPEEGRESQKGPLGSLGEGGWAFGLWVEGRMLIRTRSSWWVKEFRDPVIRLGHLEPGH